MPFMQADTAKRDAAEYSPKEKTAMFEKAAGWRATAPGKLPVWQSSLTWYAVQLSVISLVLFLFSVCSRSSQLLQVDLFVVYNYTQSAQALL